MKIFHFVPRPFPSSHPSQYPVKTGYKALKSTMSLENVEKYVKYNEEYGVLICIQHQYALMPGMGIKNHLNNFHTAIPLEIRNSVIEYSKTLNLVEPENVFTPIGEQTMIKELKLYKDGFICTHKDCTGHVEGTQDMMWKHCKTVHKRTKKDGIMWRNQAVQTFFPSISLL